MPSDKFAVILGRFLLRVRKSLGTSQGLFAARLGIPPSNLAELERGEGNPTTATLDALLKALGMDVKALCLSLLANELRARGPARAGHEPEEP